MAHLVPAKITIDTSSPDGPAARVGDTALDIIGIGEDGRVVAECDQCALLAVDLDEFPDELTLEVRTNDGFGTFLFHEVEIHRDGAGQLVADHICHQPNKYWEGTWGLATLLGCIRDQLPFFPEISLGDIGLEDDWKRLTLRMPLGRGSAADALYQNGASLKEVIREAEIALGGIQWKPEYAKDERAFCEEVIAQLLRRMKFLAVRYTQGVREYGKDFTFSELTPFGALRHYGLQAKAGDVSGKVNAAIDELIGQADDAFKMPYYDISSREPRYIAAFIGATSGRFTGNAKEKIMHKVPRGLHGSVLFLEGSRFSSWSTGIGTPASKHCNLDVRPSVWLADSSTWLRRFCSGLSCC